MAGFQYFKGPFPAPETFTCMLCPGWTTTSNDEKLYHMVTHRLQRPKPMSRCKYACGFRSTEIDAILSHELSSHKRKDFLKGDQLHLCHYCGLFALGKDKLASHMRDFHNKNEGSTSNADALQAQI